MRMKKILCLLLMLILLTICATVVAQETLNTVENGSEFPFLAETNELTVKVRADMSTGAKSVGELKRGVQLTVLSTNVNQAGEVWHAVELLDGTQGYIRGDLLIASEELEIERAAYEKPKSEEQLIGNKKTKKYHEPHCRALPAEKNRVFFETADEAESKGYVHCKNCD